MAGPAASEGLFTNPLYCPSGTGTDVELAMSSGPVPVRNSATTLSEEEKLNANACNFAEIFKQESLARADLSKPSVRKMYEEGGGGVYIGTVLYPAFSQKKLVLWQDYFFRHHSTNQSINNLKLNNSKTARLASNAGCSGSVAPFGAAVTTMRSPEYLLHACVKEEKERRVAAEARVRELEEELAKLKNGDGVGSVDGGKCGGEGEEKKASKPVDDVIDSFHS